MSLLSFCFIPINNSTFEDMNECNLKTNFTILDIFKYEIQMKSPLKDIIELGFGWT